MGHKNLWYEDRPELWQLEASQPHMQNLVLLDKDISSGLPLAQLFLLKGGMGGAGDRFERWERSLKNEGSSMGCPCRGWRWIREGYWWDHVFPPYFVVLACCWQLYFSAEFWRKGKCFPRVFQMQSCFMTDGVICFPVQFVFKSLCMTSPRFLLASRQHSGQSCLNAFLLAEIVDRRNHNLIG